MTRDRLTRLDLDSNRRQFLTGLGVMAGGLALGGSSWYSAAAQPASAAARSAAWRRGER